MTEETTNTQQDQGQTQDAEPSEPQGSGRNYEKLFKDSTRREQELRDRLSAIEKAQADAKVAEERAKLEAKGEYDKIVEQIREQHEREREEHRRELLQRDLRSALMEAGARNPVFIKGAVADFTGTEDAIAEYVQSLKGQEFNADFFGEPRPAGQPPALNSQPGTRSRSQNWAQIKADLYGKDKAKAKEAARVLESHIQEKGTLPDGY